ncbi:MAG: metallophosphoesterase family protein [Phycisphaeraceae bacterium]|nr:metallophosphoesterase family protein [Phycisphaeraceae bacterium]
MERIGVISDIHGNLPALEAVLDRLADEAVDRVVCLGDVVGYGPHPAECLDRVIRWCSSIVRGNHDEAVLDPRCAGAFNGAAREAVNWTRERLGPLHLAAINRMRSSSFIGPDDEVMLVHDNPWPGPIDYVHDKLVAALAFRGVDRPICLLGHTHVPMVFESPDDDPARDLSAVELTAFIPADGLPIRLAPGRRYICNPGSVGQPRDCDPRASFAVLDLRDRTFTVHRAAYDIAAVQSASLAAGLPAILADRLAIGA